MKSILGISAAVHQRTGVAIARFGLTMRDTSPRLKRAILRVKKTTASRINLLTWSTQYLPHHFTLAPSELHRYLAAQLDDMHKSRGQKLNVIGPRGSAKSTVATLAAVLRAAVEASEPYIWIISDTRQQAATHLENVKYELTENQLLAANYPEACGPRKGEPGIIWRCGKVILKNRVVIEAFGTGQKIRGKRARANRPTLVICDDIQNDAHAASPTLRAQSRAWFLSAVLNAGTTSTNYIHLATALHREALALELDRTPGWQSRKFRALEQQPTDQALWEKWRGIYCNVDRPEAPTEARAFYEEHRAEMDAGAIVLWPDSEDLYALMKLSVEIGRSAFEREKQCSPIDPERCEFAEEWFTGEIWFDEWPSNLVARVLALDPSKGASDRLGDYSAFALVGVDRAGVHYVAADVARRPTTQIVADGVRLARRFRPDNFGVEANQFQELLARQIVEELANAHLIIPLTAIQNTSHKRVRIRRLEPLLANRKIRFKRGCPGTRILIDQLRDFPIADHDDAPDALEMAVRLIEDLIATENQTDGLGDHLILES